MNKTLTYNGHLFVDVPEGAEQFDLPEQDHGAVLQYKANNRWNTEVIPPGSYSLVGKSKELDWKAWAGIVDKSNDESDSLNCWWYKLYNQPADMWTKNPTKSGLSLIQDFQMENPLILKIENK